MLDLIRVTSTADDEFECLLRNQKTGWLYRVVVSERELFDSQRLCLIVRRTTGRRVRIGCKDTGAWRGYLRFRFQLDIMPSDAAERTRKC